MRNMISYLLASLLVVATCLVLPVHAQTDLMHNSLNSLDVDANGFVQPRDALLIINHLERDNPANIAAAMPLTSTPSFYWDTNSDNIVTPLDALLVINNLNLALTPEPSSIVSAGLGVSMLVAYLWRRKRSKA